MRNAGRAILGIIGWCVVNVAQKKPDWDREDELAFRAHERAVRFQREADAIIISLLADRKWSDLAHIAAMRASGKSVKVAIVSAEGQVIEVLDVS